MKSFKRKLDGLSSGKLEWHFCVHTQVNLVARRHLNHHLHMYFIEEKKQNMQCVGHI